MKGLEEGTEEAKEAGQYLFVGFSGGGEGMGCVCVDGEIRAGGSSIKQTTTTKTQ